MASSHLLPVAAPQHHTGFTSHSEHVDLQNDGSGVEINGDIARHAADNHPAHTHSTVDKLYENPRLEAVEAKNRIQTQKSIADEQIAPTLNIRIPSRRKTLVLCFDGTGTLTLFLRFSR